MSQDPEDDLSVEVDFFIPLAESELMTPTDDVHRFVVSRPSDSPALDRRFTEFDDLLRGSPAQVTRRSVFDRLYHAVSSFSALAADSRAKLIDVLCTSVSSISRSVQSLPALAECAQLSQASQASQGVVPLSRSEAHLFRNAVKMSCFLLTWVIRQAERDAIETASATVKPVAAAAAAAVAATKTPARGKRQRKDEGAGSAAPVGWAVEEVREKALSTLLEILETDHISRLWRQPKPEDDFVAMFTRAAFAVLENPTNTRSKTIKRCVSLIVGSLVKRYNQVVGVTTTAVHLLHSHEHVPVHLAEMYEAVAAEFGGTHAVGSAIREIAKIGAEDLAREATLAKNVSAFLCELSERLPAIVLPAVSVLLPHLGGESHIVRNGIVQALGVLALKGFSASPGDADGERPDSTTRESLLSVLEERFYDVSSFARSKVLQTWVPLLKERVVPLKRLHSVAEKTVERLEDRTAAVRKSAAQLLSVLLQYNPYASKLSLSQFKQKRELCDSIFQDIEQNPSDAEEEAAGDEMQDCEALKLVDPKRISDLFAGTPFEAVKAGPAQLLSKLRQFHSWSKDGAAFTELVHKSIGTVGQFLASKTATDVLEAIDFLVNAKQFGIENADAGVRRMLCLVWSKEPAVCDALVAAYSKLYFSHPRPREVAENLVQLVLGASPADLASLDELIGLMHERGHIEESTVAALFDVLLGTGDRSRPPEARRSALAVIGMIAGADPQPIAVKIGPIVSAALGPNWAEDPELACRACEVLRRLRRERFDNDVQAAVSAKAEQAPSKSPQPGSDRAPAEAPKTARKRKKKETAEAAPAAAPDAKKGEPATRSREAGIGRLPNDHELFQTLVDVIVGKTDAPPPPYPAWAPVAEQAINAVHVLAENPDCVYENAIKRLHAEAFSDAAGVSSAKLAKLLFVVGHAAVKFLVHIEVIQKQLESAMKKPPSPKKKAKAEDGEGGEEEGGKGKKGKPKKEALKRKRSTGDLDEAAGVAQNLEGEGGQMEETEVEAMQAAAERDLVTKNLLGVYAPFIVAVCSNTAVVKFNSPDLRAAGVLALCKFMCAGGADFCSKHMTLLVTILETAPEPGLRATVVAALGDLCARYPNVTEPWTPHLYSRLRDPDARVRRNAAAVLAHLVLNDMIKLKGHVAALALAIEDPDPRVAELSRLFFTELAKKGNAVYNVLPDAISSLLAACSSGESVATGVPATAAAATAVPVPAISPAPVSSEIFRKIARFLFGFLSKERQFEALLDKLCARFRTANDARGIAFCLSLLTYNERCIRKLSELSPTYQDKLLDDDVAESFEAIIAKAKKFAKPEMKTAIEELERKIAIARGTGAAAAGTDDAAAGDGETPTSAAAPAPPPSTAKRGARRKAPPKSATAKKKQPTKRRRGGSESDEEMPSLPSSSGSESETATKTGKKEAPTKKLPPRSAAKKKPTKAKEESSGEEKEEEKKKEEGKKESSESSSSSSSSSSSDEEEEQKKKKPAKKKKATKKDDDEEDEKDEIMDSSSEEEKKPKKGKAPARKTATTKKKKREVVDISSSESDE